MIINFALFSFFIYKPRKTRNSTREKHIYIWSNPTVFNLNSINNNKNKKNLEALLNLTTTTKIENSFEIIENKNVVVFVI